eukprot:7381677-Prymnesium_polylepis.3
MLVEKAIEHGKGKLKAKEAEAAPPQGKERKSRSICTPEALTAQLEFLEDGLAANHTLSMLQSRGIELPGSFRNSIGSEDSFRKFSLCSDVDYFSSAEAESADAPSAATPSAATPSAAASSAAAEATGSDEAVPTAKLPRSIDQDLSSRATATKAQAPSSMRPSPDFIERRRSQKVTSGLPGSPTRCSPPPLVRFSKAPARLMV